MEAAERRSVTKSPTAIGRSAPARVQRVREDEFKVDPSGFLKKHKVTVEMSKGLALRYPSPDIHKMFYENFVSQMDQYAFSRHWFVLQENPDEKTYIVTPAIEKYIEHDPAWEKSIPAPLLRHVKDMVKKGNIQAPTGDYISAAYFPYLIGNPEPASFETTVGHTDLGKTPSKGGSAQTGADTTSSIKGEGDEESSTDEFNPDFAFTGFMNGCALTVTPVPQDPSRFTIWHFQSSTAYKKPATTFRQTRKPIDWFGEDEYYPREKEPPGITPKVTNFLYREKGKWNVASQVNYADSATGRIGPGGPAPRGRPLNTEGGGDPLLKLKGIYVSGMHNALNTTLRRDLEICTDQQKLLKEHQKPGMGEALERLHQDLEAMLSDEEKKLRDAKDAPTLRGAAEGILKNRQENGQIIKNSANALGKAFRGMAKEESTKFFFMKSDTRRQAYSETAARLESIHIEYSHTEWVEELIKETTPEASRGEEGSESLKEESEASLPAETGPDPPSDSSGGRDMEPSSRPDTSSTSGGGLAQLVPVPPGAGLFGFLDGLDPGWDDPARPREGGDEGMIVGTGPGVMLGSASKAKDMAPVGGEIILSEGLGFPRNNGSGARCFIYSVVMALTGLPQAAVEDLVTGIALAAGAQAGWIASDSDVALAVLTEIERLGGDTDSGDRAPKLCGRADNLRTVAQRVSRCPPRDRRSQHRHPLRRRGLKELPPT